MPAKTLKLAEYLFTRLRQLGIDSVHGVPGDYNLTLLDYVEPSGLLWVGNTNELNAGYAADGSARMKGLGALITTYGVGELSAINAIACAYTERAAVVHIVGTPPRDSQDSRLMIHHTLGDGDYRHFGQMSAHVTVAQVNLMNAQNIPAEIDEVLQQCLFHSRPVYIEVPVDMVDMSVSASGLESQLTISEIVPDPALDHAVATVLDRIHGAQRPVILVDGETRALRLVDAVQSLINSTGWPTFTSIFGKGLVDETLPNVHGIYRGSYANSSVKAVFDEADLILCFGPHHSTTNTFHLSAIPKPTITISFTQAGMKIDGRILRQASIQHTVDQLLQKLDPSRLKKYSPNIGSPFAQQLSFADIKRDEAIKQDKIWRLLATFLRPGDIVLGETGTAAYGLQEMPLPKHARTFTPVTWLSIGYMLPACLGAALAQRELIDSDQYHGLRQARTILLIGDGSFQMTAQELATIIRHNLNVVVFLINNDGYTIERCIHGKNQKYNDVSQWRYLQAPSLFGAPEDSFTGSAKTYGELEQLLENRSLRDGEGLRMAEVVMERNDAPAGPLLDLMNKQR